MEKENFGLRIVDCGLKKSVTVQVGSVNKEKGNRSGSVNKEKGERGENGKGRKNLVSL